MMKRISFVACVLLSTACNTTINRNMTQRPSKSSQHEQHLEEYECKEEEDISDWNFVFSGQNDNININYNNSDYQSRRKNENNTEFNLFKSFNWNTDNNTNNDSNLISHYSGPLNSGQQNIFDFTEKNTRNYKKRHLSEISENDNENMNKRRKTGNGSYLSVTNCLEKSESLISKFSRLKIGQQEVKQFLEMKNLLTTPLSNELTSKMRINALKSLLQNGLPFFDLWKCFFTNRNCVKGDG